VHDAHDSREHIEDLVNNSAKDWVAEEKASQHCLNINVKKTLVEVMVVHDVTPIFDYLII